MSRKLGAIQTELAARLNRKPGRANPSNAILKGLLYDSNGNRMIPTHARKSGVRYCYYQSWVLAQGQKDKAGIVSRVPAREIEQVVLAGLRDRFPDQTAKAENDDGEVRLIERVERIDVLPNVLNVQLRTSPTESNQSETQSETHKISIPWIKPPMFRKRQILSQSDRTTSQKPMRSETRSRLLKGIAQGRIWLDCLVNNRNDDIATISQRHSFSEKTVRSTLSLAFLAPDIIDAAIDGLLPRSLTTTKMLDLSADWQEQRKVLGLT